MDLIEEKRWGYRKVVPYAGGYWAETPECWRIFETREAAVEWLEEEIKKHQRRKRCKKLI